jgi:branched-chain amino acid transport system permease protein
MEFFTISMLNGISYGLLLFLLSSGLTLIMSMMGVLNFAHAGFYMLGAYFAYTSATFFGFWPGLIIAPLAVGILGALFERYCLRRTHKFGHVSELLVTLGIFAVIGELVLLTWGTELVDYRMPKELEGSLFSIYGTQFPTYRVFMMSVSLLALLGLWLLLSRTRIGLVIQAALTHPEMTEALGHNVPRVFMGVFGGGVALAALAGVINGPFTVTEPGMANSVGAIIFVVVVVGGLGSLAGAFWASMLIAILQTFAVGIDQSFATALQAMNVTVGPSTFGYGVLSLKISQVAPILPFLLMVLMMIFRPKGLMGTREG